MNKIQRWILIIGATIMTVVILLLPKVSYVREGEILKADITGNAYANVVDIRSAEVYGLTILVVTLIFYFAFSSEKKAPHD